MFAFMFALAAAAQAPAAQPAQKSDDPIICTKQNVGDEVGTHMRTTKKVCMRKSDREFIDKQKKEAVQQLINDGDDRGRFIPNPR
jgi:hypothetical protein